MELTYHCSVVRASRVQHIIDDIGLGQIVREKYSRIGMQPGRYICITDTGITIIKDEQKEKIITMYVTTFRELVSVYGGTKKIPTFLRRRVDRNQTYYTYQGKTIWK